MKLYELTYLISSKLSEEEARTLQLKITSLIQEQEGVLFQEKIPVKRNLAYPIKKESQAFLATIKFQMLPEKLSAFEKKIKEEKKILRYLILNEIPLKKPKNLRVYKREPIKEKKVELKEIGKKLEEILKK